MKKNNNRYYPSCDPFCFVRNRTLPRNLYGPKEDKREKSYHASALLHHPHANEHGQYVDGPLHFATVPDDRFLLLTL
jgi:hypothetical protein